MRMAEENHRELKMLHGTDLAHWCEDCAHLRRMGGMASKSVFKCTKARVTSSAASDWRARWQACGLFAPAQPPAL